MNFIALKMLTGDRAKYLAILMGLTFASLLTTQQLAIFLGYMTRTYAFIDDVAGGSAPAGGAAAAAGSPDVWVMNPEMEFTDDVKRMQGTDLYRVRGVRGVAWAVPMFKGVMNVRLASGHETACTLIGIDDATLAGGPATMVQGRLEDLRHDDGVILDAAEAAGKLAKPANGGTSSSPLVVGDTLEINDHRATVVGLSRITKAFFWQPVIYTTYSRATTFAPQQRRMLTFVLAKAQPGQDPQALCDRIRRETRLAAYTNSGFRNLTSGYVIKQTGIAVNFGMSVFLAVIIGAAIAGQTFYNFTHDHLRHFGMLKAMGAGNGVLLRMILVQALSAGAIGYGLGVGAAAIFGRVVGGSGEVAFHFPGQLLAVNATIMTLICVGPALLSVRKVLKLEPAVVFKA